MISYRRILFVFPLLLVVSQAAFAQSCQQLCSADFWKSGWLGGPSYAKIEAAISREGVNAKNRLGNTPLHYASALGAVRHIRALINAGADIEARNHDGQTPLHSAAAHGSPNNIRILLERGANIEITAKNNWTPLHIAALLGTPENVVMLLDARADPKMKAKHGHLPIELANHNRKLTSTDAYWRLDKATNE